MELVGERYRPALGTAIQVAFSLGYMLQPVLAYKLRDEFWYQVAATSPNLIFPFVVMYVSVSFLKPFLSYFLVAHVACFFVVIWFVVISNYFVRGPLAFSSCVFWHLESLLSHYLLPEDCLSSLSLRASCWTTKINCSVLDWICINHVILLNAYQNDSTLKPVDRWFFQSVLHWGHFTTVTEEVVKIVYRL